MKLLDFRKALFFLLAISVFISCEKNQPPTCQFLKPADGYTANKGDMVTIAVSADDAEGTVTEVRLFINEEGLASLDFPYNYELNTDNYRSGPYIIKLTAKDDEGLESSAEIEIIIDAIYSIVSTTEVSDINYNSAVAGGAVSDDGGAEISETGVYWDTIPSPETAGNQIPMGQGLGVFTGTLSELPHGKQIYYKAYAVNSAGISIGEEFSFMTNTIPTVKTGTIQSVGFASALVSGEIVSDGGETITEKGIYWSTDTIADITGTRLLIEGQEAEYSTTLTDLSTSTTYYVKAFAVNAAGESLGEEVHFTTTGTATVLTHEARSNRYTSRILSGGISDNGGNELSETGFYFGTSPDPASSGSRISVGSEMGEFTSTQIDLVPGSTYYYTAFAVNEAGESLGEIMSFELTHGEEGSITDSRDQKEYGTIQIGEQVWMSENLRATQLNDGTEIPYVTDSTSWYSNGILPAYGWPEYDPKWEERGALYNYYVIETGKLCPAGWHVPSAEEWRELEYYLGMEESTILTDGFRGDNEGGMLKTTTLWDSPNTGATDELGFSALPTGRFGFEGDYGYLNSRTFFWASTRLNWNRPMRRMLDDEHGQLSRSVVMENSGLSVRCVKDE